MCGSKCEYKFAVFSGSFSLSGEGWAAILIKEGSPYDTLVAIIDEITRSPTADAPYSCKIINANPYNFAL